VALYASYYRTFGDPASYIQISLCMPAELKARRLQAFSGQQAARRSTISADCRQFNDTFSRADCLFFGAEGGRRGFRTKRKLVWYDEKRLKRGAALGNTRHPPWRQSLCQQHPYWWRLSPHERRYKNQNFWHFTCPSSRLASFNSRSSLILMEAGPRIGKCIT